MIKERIAVQPGAPLETDMWLDTSGETPILKVFLNGQWVPISGGSAVPDGGGEDGSGDGGGVPSERASLNDFTCTCNNPNIADTSATGISKSTVCQTFGISEEDLEKLMLGEYAFVKFVSTNGSVLMLQVLSCTYMVVPDFVPEIGGRSFPGIVSFGGGVSYCGENSGEYNNIYIIVADNQLDDSFDDNNGWSFYVIAGDTIQQHG